MQEDLKIIEVRIIEIENAMQAAEFWLDKVTANEMIKELKILKNKLLGEKVLDQGGAIINITAGAGGDDSEDWAYMLFDMYSKYFEKSVEALLLALFRFCIHIIMSTKALKISL